MNNKLENATATPAAERITIFVEIELGRLFREDRHLHHLLTHSVELADRPKTPKEQREHAVSRVLYTWLRREEENAEEVALDIETLAALGRSEKWKTAIRTWAHIARHDTAMFMQYATYTNFKA